jgi:hypothetical protein
MPLATARRLDAAGVWPRHLPTGPSSYRPFDDTVGWEVPADHDGSPLLGRDAYFTAFPADAAVLSIDIAAKRGPGGRAAWP